VAPHKNRPARRSADRRGRPARSPSHESIEQFLDPFTAPPRVGREGDRVVLRAQPGELALGELPGRVDAACDELVAVDSTWYTTPQLEERQIFSIEGATARGLRDIAADGRSRDQRVRR